MTKKRVKKKLKRIVYQPPPRKLIDAYAEQVCNRLAERDASYANPQVVGGLARFLNVIAAILAKDLNGTREMEDKLDSKGE